MAFLRNASLGRKMPDNNTAINAVIAGLVTERSRSMTRNLLQTFRGFLLPQE